MLVGHHATVPQGARAGCPWSSVFAFKCRLIWRGSHPSPPPARGRLWGGCDFRVQEASLPFRLWNGFQNGPHADRFHWVLPPPTAEGQLILTFLPHFGDDKRTRIGELLGERWDVDSSGDVLVLSNSFSLRTPPRPQRMVQRGRDLMRFKKPAP